MASQALFTSRTGGWSGGLFSERNLATHVGDDPDVVLRNRQQLATEIGVRSDRLFFMEQVHGSEVIVVDESSDPSELRRCDAMITRIPGTALAVLVADCAPLLLLGERTSAVVHVGWRGLFAGIVEKVLDAMDSERFTALIGPTICASCYQVGTDLYGDALERGFIVGSQTLDIPGSIIKILHEVSGNRVERAEWDGICTLESASHYSYRRDQITGRQAGVVIHDPQI